MKIFILALIIGLLLSGCGKPKPPVRPLYYDKSKTVAPMKNGKLEGLRKAYRGNGSLISLTTYKNGEKEGVEKFYNHSGKLLSEISYKNGEKDGLSKEWNLYKNKITRYSITPYTNGKINGIDTHYYANGKVSSTTPYLNGKREGVSKSWDRNGLQSTITPYKNNKVEGTTRRFFDGKLTYKGTYTNDEKSGIHKSYYLNGEIEETAPYVDGKIEGNVKYYNEDGSLNCTVVFVDGVEGQTTYSKKEIKRRAEAQKRSTQKARTQAVQLRCGWEDSHPSMSEVSRKTAIARGKGEGAALGFQMKGNTISTSRLNASNYCTQNANVQGLSCTYAQAYLSGCMSKFGY